MEVNHPNNTDTVSTTIDFASNSATGADSVTDPSFTLLDLDSPSSGGYQDQVTIYAYDVNGNLLPVTLTAVDPTVVSVSGSTATANVGAGSGGSQSGNVADTSTEGNVEVSISGEVAQIVIVYGNGPLANSNPTPQQIGISDLTFDLQAAAICFTRGTLILTADGERLIETLVPGDRIVTADHGEQHLRWIGKRRVAGIGKNAPVRFAAGSIDNSRPLVLSPLHRVLLSGWKVGSISGHVEVLATAKHLVNGKDIVRFEEPDIEYYHLLFDRHEMIFAEGAACESLFVSAHTFRTMGQASRNDIKRSFPDLYQMPQIFGSSARPCLREYEARLVA